jgi:hypothetical protein
MTSKKNLIILLSLFIIITVICGCTPKQPTNNPPNAPSNPNPPNGATGVVIAPVLSWECSDPDGDTLVFDIYFGKSADNLTPIKQDYASKSYQVMDLAYSTTYYWKIVAKDRKGGVKEGPVWSFTTKSQEQTNNPPNTPSSPYPQDNETGVPINVILSWECSDLDNDSLVFDIYLGVSQNNLGLLVSNHSTSSFEVKNLAYNTTYYWKVVAKDSKGAISEGPVWKFTTTQSGDVAKAKLLVADLRNTILTIHDYKGIGVPGIVDTPFNRLSEEIQEKIVPDLSETMYRIGFVLACTSQTYSGGTYTFEDTDLGYTLNITFNTTQTGNTSTITISFNGYKNNTIIDSGNIKVNFDASNFPTGGELNAIFGTKDGNLSINGNFTATKLEHLNSPATLTITGTIVSNYLNIDFKNNNRKLYVEFGEWYDSNQEVYRDYLKEILISGLISTTTAQAEGNLDMNFIHVYYQNGSTQNPPQNISFTGTFRELKNGMPTGAYFTGTITGQYLNADTYDITQPESPTNFPKWKANFVGHIEAPNRPKIDANLGILHDTYQVYVISAGYERTNPDGTKVWLKTPDTPVSSFNEATKILDVTLNNQDGLIVKFTVDGNQSGDSVFTGTIRNNAGFGLANLYLLNGVPMVRYNDGYIESIF